MSTEANYCVGPAIKLKIKKVVVPYTKNCCVNKACTQFQKVTNKKFCGDCGQSIETIPFTRDEEYGYYNFVNDIDPDGDGEFVRIHTDWTDGLKKDEELLVGDRKNKPDERLEILTPNDVETELTKFREKYKETISKLEECFGKENITVAYYAFVYRC